RVRRLSPLQTVEDQSQAWGIRCHSCTWREGFAPSWNTELQGSYLPCGLPGSRSFLSTNGSHLNERGVDLPAAGRQHLLDRLKRAEHDPVCDGDQTAPPHGLDHLRVEQLRQRHPARLGVWPLVLAAGRLHPLAEMGEERGGVLLEAVGEDEGHTA